MSLYRFNAPGGVPKQDSSEDPGDLQDAMGKLAEGARKRMEDGDELADEQLDESASAPATAGEDSAEGDERAETSDEDDDPLSLLDQTSASLKWTRNLALRKATFADELEKLLERSMGGEDVSEQLRDLRARQNEKVEPSGIPGLPAPQDPLAGVDEESGMAGAEAMRFMIDERIGKATMREFSKFMQDPENLKPDDLVPGNVYQTMKNGFARFRSHRDKMRSGASDAAKQTRSLQRQVARAQTGAVTGARGRAGKPVNVNDMTVKEMYDSGLMQQAIEQVFNGDD